MDLHSVGLFDDCIREPGGYLIPVYKLERT